MSSTTATLIIASLYVLSNIGNSRKNIECSDAYECQDKSKSSNLISCQGYGSCLDATLIAKGQVASQIECTGNEACREAKQIKAGKLIYCQGKESCYGAKEIDAKSIECSGAYSCSTAKKITCIAELACGGLESCKGADIKCDRNILCDGLSSCNGATMMCGDDLKCTGQKSCIGAKLTTLKNVECTGNLSCKRAKITASEVKLHGALSGHGAKINADIVEAQGYSAIEECEIDSKNKTNIRVKASGESVGKGATVLCETGSNCKVVCTDDCENLEVLTFSDSTTDITADGDPCPSGQNITGCPKEIVSNSDCEDRELMTYLNAKRERIAARRAILDEIESNEMRQIEKTFDERRGENNHLLDAMDEVYPELQHCDEKSECENIEIIGQDAQCYGYESCQGATIDQTDSNDYVITSFGERSAEGGLFNTRGEMECNGKESCANARYFTTKSVECGGTDSCQAAHGNISVGSIDCEASRSCMDNEIIAKQNVKCLANRACSLSDITAGNNILCDGNYACNEATLTTQGPIKCTGEYSCQLATINTTKYVYLDGGYSGFASNIYSPIVRAYGLYSIQGATIDSQGFESLKVQVFGDMAGKDGTIICRSGSTCKIFCETTGCRNLELICLDGSFCKTDPKECLRERGPKQIGEIYCPTYLTDIPSNDEELAKYVEEKRMKVIQQAQIDNNPKEEIFVDIDSKQENNNKKFVIARWDIRFFLCVALLIIAGIICYSGYDYYYKWRNQDTSDYQYLK